VDHIHYVLDSSSSLKSLKGKGKVNPNTNVVPMLHQFHLKCHSYILDVNDVKVDEHCEYRVIASLLGLGEDSWPLFILDLFKEISSGVKNTRHC